MNELYLGALDLSEYLQGFAIQPVTFAARLRLAVLTPEFHQELEFLNRGTFFLKTPQYFVTGVVMPSVPHYDVNYQWYSSNWIFDNGNLIYVTMNTRDKDTPEIVLEGQWWGYSNE